MSWQKYRTTSRVLRAMAILADGHRSVLDAATTVGFESLSGFTRAFIRLTGERPRDYRRRVQARPTPSPPNARSSIVRDRISPRLGRAMVATL